MRIALFSPFPPARSGIADYSAALAAELAKLAQVDIYERASASFDPRSAEVNLYQVGNNPCHDFVYDAALRYPGVVVLHEANLHHLIAEITIRRDDWDAYLAEVEYDSGPAAAAYAQRVRALEVGPDYDGVPMLRRILERSRGLVVHSRSVAATVRRAGFDGPVAVIPHGAWIPQADRLAYRARLGLDESIPLIGVFGFLKPYKRIAESLRAMRRLLRVEPRARLIFVGEPHPDLPLDSLIGQTGLAHAVRVLGFTPIEDFTGYLAACDIVLNLRYPTVGESSGTLQRALGLGRAVLVSDVGSFCEYPDDICLKVPVDTTEEDHIFEYLSLLVSRPALVREMGARARRWVERECRWDIVAARYFEFLSAVVAGSPWPDPLAAAPAAAPLAERLGPPSPESPAGPQPPSPESPAAARPPSLEPRVAAQPPPPGSPAAPQPPPPGSPAAPQPPPPGSPAVAEYLKTWATDSASVTYLDTHLARLEHTLAITPPGAEGDRILEMGVYLQVTPALRTKLGYGEVRGCYYGPAGGVDPRTVTSADGETFACDVDLFDAEKDPFPYPDGCFATVLCCELIEHLPSDPMHMMSEINRILKPGGHLVLTTPNLGSLRAISAILQGYHPGFFPAYIKPAQAGKEPDARHNREYVPREIHELLEDSGFEVIRLETGLFRDEPHPELHWVTHLLERYQLSGDLRGDGIYAVGRKTGAVRERYPSWLYD